jgi:DNA helicase-2/ATP-dependent DNA helicase PcrA
MRPLSRPPVIEGDGRLIATSDPLAATGAFRIADRVFHQKFGYGTVRLVEGAKLTVAFEKAGEKRVIESFLEKA